MDNLDDKSNDKKVYYNIKQESGITIIEKKIYDSNFQEIKENNNWYNILKNEKGKTIIEKVDKKSESSNYKAKQIKRKNKMIPALCSFLAIIILITITLLVISNISSKKKRTFMIYMVGSDLESNGSFATFDLNDITNSDIDLKNNNIILMIGGSKKWHNFANENEIGIYELQKSGFKKINNYPVTNMATSKSLSFFLNYVYKDYKSEEYDLIFWNHGLGAAGLESDEISDDFIDLIELDDAFKNSSFNNEKLELVIFNNCLSGNYQFANVMSKYADYMVGSEEVMYVSAFIDRLNFLEKVKKEDNGYDIGKYYIDISDDSMKRLNELSYQKYDSTLSIIDLSNMHNLDKTVNDFISSIDLSKDYYGVSRARFNTYTYSKSANYIYDTVDLYELVEELEPYSNDSKLAKKLKNEIKNTVKYNSAINNHSNGLSIYFPYYGGTNNIEIHLYLFNKLWDDDYTNFISNYYESNSKKKRANRATSELNINKLTNDISIDADEISIELTDDEKSNYQRGNIYLFKKNSDNLYTLAVKSNNIELENNTLKYRIKGIIKNNDDIVSLIDTDEQYVYSQINEIDTISKIKIDDDVTIIGTTFDNEKLPSGAIIDDISNIKYYQLIYSIDNEEIETDIKEKIDKKNINNSSKELQFIDTIDEEYYVLIEYFDINNDNFFTNLKKIDK